MIYDGFIFFNELDILEIRLNVMSSSVDRFILVESDKTFQGKPKPLFYQENMDRFIGFRDRIIHVIVNDMPDGTAWEREYHQRNCIARGLPSDGQHGDVLIVSDVDEIPDLSDLRLPLCGWRLDYYYYFLNLLTVGKAWPCVMACTLEKLRQHFDGQPHKLREHRYVIPLSRKGWHFSYLGGPEKVKTKIESFAHTEFLHRADLPLIEKALSEDWKNGVDVLGREMEFHKQEDLSFLPEYLRVNQKKYQHLFCP